MDGPLSTTPTGANGISSRMLRSRSEQYHLNHAGFSLVTPVGLPHPQSNLSMPGLGLNKYTSLKAVADTASRGYYKSYPLLDFSQHRSPPACFQPMHMHLKDKSCLHQVMPCHDIHSPLSITIPPTQLERSGIPKTITHPHLSSSAFKAWDSGQRHVYRQTSHPGQASRRQTSVHRRQYSMEEFPSQPSGYGGHHLYHPYPKLKAYQTNSKTEVTV